MAKLIKLVDNFQGKHPNGIDEGYTKVARQVILIPTVGDRYYFGTHRTSTVTELVSNDGKEIVFKTRNSTYKVIR